MSDFTNFSSMTPQDEQTFVVYEQTTSERLAKAKTASIIAAVAVFVIAIGLYFGVAPDTKDDVSKDMDMSNLTKK